MMVPPVQDLITDVMAAADPASQRTATSRLERLSSAVGADFSAVIDQKIKTAGAEGSSGTAAADETSSVRAGAVSTSGGGAQIVKRSSGDAYRKFEAFVLQMFVESMLPKDATEVFGKGTAGTVWRSMLAEQISNEMAKGNGVGIAKQLAKSRAAAENSITEG